MDSASRPILRASGVRLWSSMYSIVLVAARSRSSRPPPSTGTPGGSASSDALEDAAAARSATCTASQWCETQ
eukprot:8738444-Pyramimonas_sp.AAC.1